MTDLERKLLMEQVRKETLDGIKPYTVGMAKDGELVVTKGPPEWNGYILVIPDNKYKELFEEG